MVCRVSWETSESKSWNSPNKIWQNFILTCCFFMAVVPLKLHLLGTVIKKENNTICVLPVSLLTVHVGVQLVWSGGICSWALCAVPVCISRGHNAAGQLFQLHFICWEQRQSSKQRSAVLISEVSVFNRWAGWICDMNMWPHAGCKVQWVFVYCFFLSSIALTICKKVLGYNACISIWIKSKSC